MLKQALIFLVMILSFVWAHGAEWRTAPVSKAEMPVDWTAYRSAKLAVAFSYPKSVFRLSETPTQVTLASTLSRDQLGGDPKPRKWTYGARILVSPLSPERYLARHYKAFHAGAFPGGVFKETESITAEKLAGREGYRLWAGIEGYNERVVVLKRGAGSVALHLRTIGSVMSPPIPEDEQVKVLDQLLVSLRID